MHKAIFGVLCIVFCFLPMHAMDSNKIKELENEYRTTEYGWQKRKVAFELARYYTQERNMQKQEEWYRQLEDLYNDKEHSHAKVELALNLASLYEKKDDSKKQLEWYKKALVEPEYAFYRPSSKEDIEEKADVLEKKIISDEVDNILEEPLKLLAENKSDMAMQQLKILFKNTDLLGEVRVTIALEIAKIYEQKKEEEKVLEWYGKAVQIKIEAEFYSPQQDAKNKIINEGKKLVKEKKINEAIKIYQYAGNVFEGEITALNKQKQYQSELANAQQLMNENNFIESRKILEELKNKNVGIALTLLNELNKKESEASTSREKEKELPEWMKAMPFNETNKEEKEWRIQDGWLEFNKEAEMFLTGDTLEDLIHEAFENKLPCLVTLAVTSKDEYTLFDTIFFGEAILKEGKASIALNPLAQKREDRTIKTDIQKSYIFVIGKEDSQFTLLKELKDWQEYTYFFQSLFDIKKKKTKGEYDQEVTLDVYEPKKALTTKGEAQLEIAKILKQQGQFQDAMLWKKRGESLLKKVEPKSELKQIIEPKNDEELKKSLSNLNMRLKILNNALR